MKVIPAPDCHIASRIIGLDNSRMHQDHMGVKPYPAAPLSPMVVTRGVGAGGDLSGGRAGRERGTGEGRECRGAAGWPRPRAGPPAASPARHQRAPLGRSGHPCETRPAGRLRAERDDEQTGSEGVIRYVVPLANIELNIHQRAGSRRDNGNWPADFLWGA